MTPPWFPEAVRLYDLGLPAREVGAQVGVNGSTVLAWLHREGHPVRKQGGHEITVRLPVVHLMITDFGDPDYTEDCDVFTRCCGYNWRALIAQDLVTSRPDLVTCPGRAA